MNKLMLTLTFVATALFAGPAFAQNESPYLKADDTWINIDGTVDKVSADSFLLNYGTGTITVEMDDGDRDADGYKLNRNDKVRVSGRIDDDFFEKTKIEASAVYVENLGTYFFASSLDEEDAYPFVYTTPVITASTTLQGTVSEIDDHEEFVLNTGLRRVRVELDEMPYNPLDDEGYQKIRVGDRVRVSGKIDVDLFEIEGEREFVADSIVTLSR